MPKRPRSSSVTSREQEEEEDADSFSEPMKKRKRYDPEEMCQQLYDTIRNFRKEDGSLLCDAFIRVPKRRQEPGYYDVVSSPIDMLKIQQKLKTEEYEEVDQLTTDMELMVNNAKAFYKKGTAEYNDACDLWDLYSETKDSLLEGENLGEEGEPKGKIILKWGKLAKKAAAAEARKQDQEEETSENSSVSLEDENFWYEELFSVVMLATDPEGRPLHTMFQLLPSKKRYPEYYEVIDSPIDLKIIAGNVQNNKYNHISELERDLLTMTKNACTFNEPGSQIYKDAKALRKVIQAKKLEIDQSRSGSNSSKSERIRNKRLRGSHCLSAITAALQYEEEEKEEDEEEVDDDEMDNPLWQLYDAVRSYSATSGYFLSEPFLRLPSRRAYPDYYNEIKNPISLSQIRAKIKRGEYGTISEVAGDMNIMFENAKEYNRPDSRLYKDAMKLQKIMQTKVQELLESEQYTDTDDDDDGKTPKRKRQLKKRMKVLYKTLIDFVQEDGRQPIMVFMEKPSRKLYPDYYKVIAEPIDMLTIEQSIKSDKYTTEEELIDEFKMMFNNCRQYNEEGSVIYEDANTLEKVLAEKVKDLGTLGSYGRGRRSRKYGTGPQYKLKTFYDVLRDYKDAKGRQLALIFMKLPNKHEYPDYYEVIKKPLDMERISQKLKAGQYEVVEDILSDFVLMFDNACKYNEPDSQIYKDALTLQRLALQTKMQLSEDDESVPDVRATVQELLTSLFISVYQHGDEEGRCYSDSMAELPEHDDIDGKKIRAISLDLIRRRLDRGMYRRLDVFQEDMFSCFERARKISRTDSQVFEDSVELQSYYIQQRDEFCQNGDLLQSPALRFSVEDLNVAVSTVRQEKLQQEQPEEEADSRKEEETVVTTESEADSVVGTGDSLSLNQQVYYVGDFVYIEPKERGLEPHIIKIERLWINKEGEKMLYGNWFYRPTETYHVATRKFLEQEVFKTDVWSGTPLNQVVGKCFVMSVKDDYFKLKPEGYADKDVYVCESRYSTRARAFKKIKVWPWAIPDHVKIVSREVLLEPKRIMSVFRERVEKHKEEIAELEEGEKLEEKERPNVEIDDPQGVEGNKYYEQYNIPCGVMKTGDCVCVRSENGRQLIAQVDSMWVTEDGTAYFHGPWFVTPSEIPHAPTRMFYKKELFLSSIEDTNPLLAIVHKCAVLDPKDYVRMRPTECAETDVYVCESMYDEAKQQIRPLPGESLKIYSHSNAVTPDELYFFRRQIIAQKTDTVAVPRQLREKVKFQQFDENEPSPLLPKIVNDVDVIMEDSMDGHPPSVGSADTPTHVVAPTSSTKKHKAQGKKLITSYILFSSEVWKSVAAKYPDSSFGELSRIVGNEWRNLPATEKQTYEERSQKINEENAAKYNESLPQESVSPAPSVAASQDGLSLRPTTDTIYECMWDTCDWQFEDLADLMDHCIQEPNGHVHISNVNNTESEYQCQWRNCGRVKKGAPPFPNIQRLVRHTKEVHIQKANGRTIAPHERSRNYVVSRRVPSAPTPTSKRPTSATTPQPQYSQFTHAAANMPGGTPVSGHPSFAGAVPPGYSPAPRYPQPQQGQGFPSPQYAGGQSLPPPLPPKPAEPIFVAVPPRPQRLLHSEAYIKYIEGLQADNKHVSNWDRHLRATPENTPVTDTGRLPAHWLGNGVGNHGSIVNALWALRDFMMKDALGIAKVI